MAWQRTALGVGAIGALLLKTAGRSWAAVPGVLGMLVALVLIAVSEHRYVRTIRKVEAGRPAHSTTMVRLLTGITVLLAVSALLVALGVD
jgi:uncharacterized membrane protein